MTSMRNKPGDAAVLDAALECVLAVGVRRTTLTDVARRAGLSRMTLYRRWPDLDTLVADLMTRELLAVAGAGLAAGGLDRSALVERIVEVSDRLRAHIDVLTGGVDPWDRWRRWMAEATATR